MGLILIQNVSAVVVTTFMDEDDGEQSLSDLGDISLREALLYAEEGAIITFSEAVESSLPEHVIFFIDQPLIIDRSLTVDASEREGSVTIDGRGNGDAVISWKATGGNPGDVHFLENRCLYLEGRPGNLPDIDLRGLTIQNGTAFAEGGNILADHVKLTMSDCIVQGGRVLVKTTTGSDNDTEFIDPYDLAYYQIGRTRYSGGAGLVCDGGEVELQRCSFLNNQILSDLTPFDEAIFPDSSPESFSSRTIEGAGLCFAESRVFAKDCVISNNLILPNLDPTHILPRTSGGGVLLWRSQASFTDCLISNNQSRGIDADGGGVDSVFSLLTMDSCSIINNRALDRSGHGGGLMLNQPHPDFPGIPNRITNCTIADNHGDTGGGGMIFWHSNAVISHCTMVRNSAPDDTGGGFDFRGRGSLYQAVLGNSILAENLGGNMKVELGSSITSAGGNILGPIGPLDGSMETTGSDHLDVEDPYLMPLGDYGAFGPTCPPLPGSPALNSALLSDVEVDQHGNSRSTLGFPDSGSVEHQSSGDWAHLGDEDWDGDGLSLRVELATGSDPWTALGGGTFSLSGLVMSEDGLLLSAPFSREAMEGTRWQISRSADLVEAFEPIFVYEIGVGLIHGEFSEPFSLPGDRALPALDPEAPLGRAFYRLEILGNSDIVPDE